jgi:hypothetical protein
VNRGLPSRVCSIRVGFDLAALPESRIISLIWPRVGGFLHSLYLSRSLDVSVGPVELLPRNRVELWPMREVKLSSVDGKIARSAMFSLDEQGKPLVYLLPPCGPGQTSPIVTQ